MGPFIHFDQRTYPELYRLKLIEVSLEVNGIQHKNLVDESGLGSVGRSFVAIWVDGLNTNNGLNLSSFIIEGVNFKLGATNNIFSL